MLEAVKRVRVKVSRDVKWDADGLDGVREMQGCPMPRRWRFHACKHSSSAQMEIVESRQIQECHVQLKCVVKFVT